jgi:hypothetical protein
MRFQIQLLTEGQRCVRISSAPVPSPKENKGPAQFDSVSIDCDGAGHPMGVSFLVPAGRGEGLAEALRKAMQ